MQYPAPLLKLMQMLRKLPGVGAKSAERYAFEMFDWKEGDLKELAVLVGSLKEQLQECFVCGCLISGKSCSFCLEPSRDKEILCVIATPRDVFAMEQTREYRGLYHVLGGVLSPLEGKGPGQLRVEPLKARIIQNGVKEVVIALDSTLEGDATSLYLKRELISLGVGISRLAFGLPMGSSLEYVDGGTLARALSGRSRF